jgi:uncharacterized protein (UPF0332 family)
VAFDWRDFRHLAQQLADDEETPYGEAASRTAVSRLYYYVFHRAKAYARQTWGYRSPARKADDHQELAEVFKSHGRDDVEEILTEMRNARNNCDYEDTFPFLEVALHFGFQYADDLERALQ